MKKVIPLPGDNRTRLLLLIGLDIFMAIGSNIADWPWLTSVKWYLMPFAPICSLYPLTLAIWFSLYYMGKKIPGWLTTFIFIGITSYGIMAWLYFPMFMSWDGIKLRTIGNMLWVTVYALQALIIKSHLKKIPVYQYALIFSYFIFKDYADRFLDTFIDLRMENYPQIFITIFWYAIIALHIFALIAAIKIGYKNSAVPKTGQLKIPAITQIQQ